MTDTAPRPTAADQIHQDIVRRAEQLLDDLRRRHTTGRAPDIRTVTNRLDAARTLLDLVREQLGELYVLANDRPRAAERLNVLGGSRDYALDGHGDPKARELYRHVALELVNLLELMAVSAHTMHGWLRRGEIDTTRRRGAQLITDDELIEVLAAQQRRIDRGEGDAPLVAQPTRKTAAEIAPLQRTIRDLQAVIGKTLPRLTNSQRGALTNAEQLAHRAAVDAHRQRRQARTGHPS